MMAQTAGGHPGRHQSLLDPLPDELLLQVFSHLTDVGPCWETNDDPWFIKKLPYRNNERDEQPHPGIRAYPFLGQVCKKWNHLLNTPLAQRQIWKDVVLDFGHELVTAIHTPLKWSNERPSPDEFMEAFQSTSLSANKMVDFVLSCNDAVSALSLCNSEGFWGEEGEYLSLNNKHNFKASHLGFLVGCLKQQLQALKLYNCNDLLSSDQGLWSIAAMCPGLCTLSVEGLNCRLAAQELAQLGRLANLEKLSIIGEERSGQWIIGMDCVPPSWSRLLALHTLELRGHQLLDAVPPWLHQLPQLRRLDLSNNSAINLEGLTALTQLEVLTLQRLDLSQAPAEREQVSLLAKRLLPDLSPLGKHLKVLSLACNRFTRLPDCLVKLTALHIIDFSSNRELRVLTPLTPLLAAMPRISILDFRSVHKDKEPNYWSDDKCTTMKHLAAASKLLKRRKYAYRVIIDSE